MSTLKIKPAKNQRLAFIEFRLFYLGSVSRQEVTERFGCSDAVATRDLSEYQSNNNENCEYEPKSRRYCRRNEEFTLTFDIPVHKALLELVTGGQTLLEDGIGGAISGNVPIDLIVPDRKIVSLISRAIFDNKALNIIYTSVNSGKRNREIIPHSIFTDGLKWYVRAFDKKRESFINFNITRINEANLISYDIKSHELIRSDEKWNATVPLVLAPHPNIFHKEAIEADYGMKNGEKIVYIKTSMVEFFLRKWNIDCSPKERLLKGDEYQLWLKNNQALIGICDFYIAPGYENHN